MIEQEAAWRRLRQLADVWAAAAAGPPRRFFVEQPVAWALLEWTGLPDDFRALLALTWLAHEYAVCGLNAALPRTRLLSPVAQEAVVLLDGTLTTRLDWRAHGIVALAMRDFASVVLESDLWLLAHAAISQELQRRLRFTSVRNTPDVRVPTSWEVAPVEVTIEVTLDRAPTDVLGAWAGPPLPCVMDYRAYTITHSGNAGFALSPLSARRLSLERAFAARFCGVLLEPFRDQPAARWATEGLPASEQLASAAEAVPRAVPRVLALASDYGFLDASAPRL